jgi:23S rRNA pseudouridine2604 synthase
MTINEFLVKYVRISKKEAFRLIQESCVLVNTLPAKQMQRVLKHEAIHVNGLCVQEAIHFQYIAFYKPRGIECTLNPDIEDNLLSVLPFSEHLFPIGRLDKESEGLLILTNDGTLYNHIALADAYKEKEYIVTVENNLTDTAIDLLSSGKIVIMGRSVRPAQIEQLDAKTFSIILTQGLNRQIRRMCHKIENEVISLKRIRISTIELLDLKPGEYRVLDRDEFGD